MPNDLFGFDDPVRALTPPAGFETVHQDGDTWAKSDGTREGTTRMSVRQANLMAAWFRGLRTIAGLDLSDLTNTDPLLLREVVTRSIAAALPAEVANQLPALADLLDEDIDLVASIAANTGFRDAVAASTVLSNALANDVDLINAVAADADLATALAASAVLVNALAASAVLANAIAADADLVNAVAADPDLAVALGVNTDLRDALAASSALVNAVAADADLISALGANTALRDALAASATLANAVANDGDLVAGLAALTSFVDAVAAALPLNLNADNLASGTVPDARLPGRLGTVAQQISDWNGALDNGWYMGVDAANAPASGWIIGTVAAHGAAGWRTQEVHAFTADGVADTKTWRREQDNGAWGAWYRVRKSEAEIQTLIDASVAALVASSPAALDTLNELAAALGNDPNFATTMTNALAAKIPTSAIATAAEVRAGTAGKVVTADANKSALAWVALADAATIAVSHTGGINRNVTIAGNRTMGSPTGEMPGMPLNIRIKQDATGGRTMAWAAAYDFGDFGVPVLSSGANQEDLLTFLCLAAGKYAFLGIRKRTD